MSVNTEIIRLYVEEKMSTRMIEKQTGIGRNKVMKILRENSVIRSRKDASKNAVSTGRIIPKDHAGLHTKEAIAKGIKKRYPKGVKGSYINKGYVVLNDGRFEHAVIMEDLIGRKLNPDEVVHHKNQVRNDNRVENLQLMTRGDHTALHMILKSRLTKSDMLEIINTDLKPKHFIKKHGLERHYVTRIRKRKEQTIKILNYVD